MTVLLQGGGEFSPGCRGMDTRLLRLVDGPVVVTALAGAPGREYDVANRNGVSHLRTCGAADVTAAPDVRDDEAGALAALERARLVVLPGGSPSRLLTALQTTPVGALLAALVADGGAVSGSSAGAMVLGDWTVLPDRRGADGGLGLARGLGLVPGVAVVPHWSGGSSRRDWLRTLAGAPEPLRVLGLPEESGVLFPQQEVLGRSPVRVVDEERDVAVGAVL